MRSENIPALAKAIERDRIVRARAESPEQKLLAGEELYRMAEKITLSGIRMQNPELDEAAALDVLRGRLERRKQQEAKRGG